MNKTKIDVTLIIFIAIATVALSSIIKIVLNVNQKNHNNDKQSYLYIITAPNLGTWQTTNFVYNYQKHVRFTIDNQEIFITAPFVITKEIYAPTNFIADDE